MRKILKAGIFAVTIMSISTMTSFAYPNWQQEESGAWRCYCDDGTLTRSDWAKSGNTWYWLDENGDIAKDTIIEDDGKKYYLDASGVLAANIWVNDEGTYYYAGSDGAFLTSTTTPDGYYVDENGERDQTSESYAQGWKEDEEGKWYSLGDGSYPKSGFYKIGEDWYYFDENGYMDTGWVQSSTGSWYYMDKNTGALLRSTTTPDGCYVDENGKWQGDATDGTKSSAKEKNSSDGSNKEKNSSSKSSGKGKTDNSGISDNDKARMWNAVKIQAKKNTVFREVVANAKFPKWSEVEFEVDSSENIVKVIGWCQLSNEDRTELPITAKFYADKLTFVKGSLLFGND